MPNELINNYMDTLLTAWVKQNENLLYGEIPEEAKTITQAAATQTSNVRTRFAEFYRVGLLKYKLERSGITKLKAKENLQSKLGFLSAAIYKANAGGRDRALGAICALSMILQCVDVEHFRFSLNFVIQRLLEAFPVGKAPLDKWVRYIISAFLSELHIAVDAERAALLKFLSEGGEIPQLRIYDIKAKETRYTFRSAEDVEDAINNSVQLIDIPNQKLGLYIADAERGTYMLAAKWFSPFLQDCYSVEQKDTKNPVFSAFWDETSELSGKATVLETLKKLSGEHKSVNASFLSVMNTIIEGASKAIDELVGTISEDSSGVGRNTIFFGVPGTGKSDSVKHLVGESKLVTRITFHPDTDYSSFVGCYKPTSNSGSGQEKISYRFVPQAFLRAYEQAWTNPDSPTFLVIEEINRGNCAQIFGDIFQLLDRKPSGESQYAITPDTDLQAYLQETFKNTEICDSGIKDGSEMRLPANLHIIATMNTSDQSLFPMDSAFRRRWEWHYIPVRNANRGHFIRVKNRCLDWWSFVEQINNRIQMVTSSEDKQIGYWFVVPRQGQEITIEDIAYKVLSYLWTDVFKDYSDSTESPFSFDGAYHFYHEFFDESGNANVELVERFLQALGVTEIASHTTSTDQPAG